MKDQTMTTFISMSDDTVLERPPLHFFEAVCIWVDHYRGLKECRIAAKYGVSAHDVHTILKERRHEGAQPLAVKTLTKGFRSA